MRKLLLLLINIFLGALVIYLVLHAPNLFFPLALFAFLGVTTVLSIFVSGGIQEKHARKLALVFSLLALAFATIASYLLKD